MIKVDELFIESVNPSVSVKKILMRVIVQGKSTLFWVLTAYWNLQHQELEQETRVDANYQWTWKIDENSC